jgi:hypothetical protein
MAEVKLKLIEQDGSSAGVAAVDDFYVPPDVVLVDEEVFISTIPDVFAREKVPRDQLTYRRAGNVVRGMIA